MNLRYLASFLLSGLKDSLCVPNAGTGEAYCTCAPGFAQVAEDRCVEAEDANMFNGIIGGEDFIGKNLNRNIVWT